ncbi:hypothetical protein [Rhizobium sp. BK456]|uniref:hypothetical protein n=1 Tax=Rhizobium sp. BK456 TaxID=2587007 RepID=UPI001608699F|nr:hypothetical protein [Rhizobium sp. BK456]MBB3525383.1 hypothetical protein [Rhizobium sp. BK456]
MEILDARYMLSDRFEQRIFLTYLKQAGLSDGRWDGPFSIQHFGFYHDTITGSLAHGVLRDGRQ